MVVYHQRPASAIFQLPCQETAGESLSDDENVWFRSAQGGPVPGKTLEPVMMTDFGGRFQARRAILPPVR
jgi:hypothetical protein